MVYQKLPLLALLTLLFSSLAAQDLSTPLLDGSWQSTFSNPASLHRLPGKVTIGLPGVYNDLFVENFTYGDLLVEQGGRTFLDANQAIGLLENRNEIRDHFDFETIGVAFRGEKWAFGFQHRIRYDAVLDYPKTLAQVIWQGNAQFIGQSVEIAPQIQVSGYHEFGFSAAYKFAKILTVGGRVKYLSGISDATTVEGGSIQLTTEEETYNLTLDQDYTINSAGAFEYNGLDGVTSNFDFASLDFSNLFGKNTGLAFDVGVQLDLNNIRLQAAALDLGASIDWKDNVRNYNLNGQESFTGLDVLQDLLNDTVSLDGLLDTIEQQFSPTETNNAYSSEIGSQFMLAGEFDFSDRITLGALLHYQNRKLEGSPSVLLSGRYRFNNFLTGGVTYGYRANSADNVGVNLTAKLGPVVALFATDNIVTAFKPKDSQRANIRVGLSLSFGEED